MCRTQGRTQDRINLAVRDVMMMRPGQAFFFDYSRSALRIGICQDNWSISANQPNPNRAPRGFALQANDLAWCP